MVCEIPEAPLNALRELQSVWHRDIPITAAMGIEIAAFDADVLRVVARLAPNVNVHGTAFAGSLFSVCALTGWGMCWLKLRERKLTAEIVLATSEIRYSHAVRTNVVCECRWSDTASQQLDGLATEDRTRIELGSEVIADDSCAVRFSGVFALRQARAI
jgi:thioesterase domain-containing protein